MICITGVNCGEPPERPGAGTWEWNGNYSYTTQISYTCGPYGKFCYSNGKCVEEVIGGFSLLSECLLQNIGYYMKKQIKYPRSWRSTSTRFQVSDGFESWPNTAS